MHRMCTEWDDQCQLAIFSGQGKVEKEPSKASPKSWRGAPRKLSPRSGPIWPQQAGTSRTNQKGKPAIFPIASRCFILVTLSQNPWMPWMCLIRDRQVCECSPSTTSTAKIFRTPCSLEDGAHLHTGLQRIISESVLCGGEPNERENTRKLMPFFATTCLKTL